MDKYMLASQILSKTSLKPQSFSTGRNSVQLEWENDEGYLELEIFDDKINILVMDKNDNVLFEF